MRLERYGEGSNLMSRMNLPTGFYHLLKSDCPDIDWEDGEVFVIFQAVGPCRSHNYHVSFRKDVQDQLKGRNIVACEILGFDKNCNAVDLPHKMHLQFTRELRRERARSGEAVFFEIDLEMKLRKEMKNTAALVPAPLVNNPITKTRGATIFIFGLPSSVCEKQLYDLCSSHGRVVSINLQRDQVGCSLGIAFVGFQNKMDSLYALSDLLTLSRYWMQHGQQPLRVGTWNPKTGMPAQTTPSIGWDYRDERMATYV